MLLIDAALAHPVERHLAKVEVASSSLVSRSKSPLLMQWAVSLYAGMMELADMRDLGSRAERRAGSTPVTRTKPTKSEPDLPYGRRVRILCFLQETVLPQRYALPAQLQTARPEKEESKMIWRF